MNSKCEYAKVAVSKCAELGISSAEYMLYLPDLLPEDADPSKSDHGGKHVKSSPVPETFDAELVKQLVAESIQSRKLLESSQSQVERMMAQLLDLKIESKRSHLNEAGSAAGGAGGGAGGGAVGGAVGGAPIGSLGGALSGAARETITAPVTPATQSQAANVAHNHTAASFPAIPGISWTSPWLQGQPGSLTGVLSGAQTGASPAPAVGTPGWGLTGAPGVVNMATAPTAAASTAAGTRAPWPGDKIGGSAVINPYLPPYLLPGANQQASVQVPYRCETDYQHPPRHSCTTGKRKLAIFDLEIHMRYTSSASVTIDDVIAGSLSLLESMIRQGVDCTGYVRHIRFLVEKSKIYVPASLIGYDAEMRERAEFFGPSVFGYGDHDLSHRWLGVESLKPVTTLTQQITKKKVSKVSRFGSCWGWNENKSCKSVPCKFKHVCSGCQGEHKLADCTQKVNASQGQKSSK